jgi:aldehyde dehydrogenase (NAD+)
MPGTPQDTIPTVTTHFIGGQFVESQGQELFDLVSPVDRAVIGRVTLGDERDARDAIAAATVALQTWRHSSLDERRDVLQRLHDAVVARTDEHVEIMGREYGAGPDRATATVARAAKAYLNAKRLLDDVPFTRQYGDVRVALKPVGVAGLITPWNSDILMISHKIAPALAAGCTVVVKPSELSSLQTQVLLECFADAELPAGLINVVNGLGEVVGNEITTNPGVAKVSFTGSTAVGKTVMRNAADTMKRVTLELGGKSATVLLDDVDLDTAIPFALTVAFMNSGQACVAGTRLVVPERLLDEVTQALLAAVPGFKVGFPGDPDTAIGPMVTAKQYERVQSYIRKGIDEGAEILIGGTGHPDGMQAGNYVKPTVFVGVTADMTIAQEEIFGPVLSVITYRDEAEAIAIANDSTYGLLGYVCGRDQQRAKQVADQIEAGGLFVNEFFDFYDEYQAPIGGFKQSGFGREFGVYGIEEYLETQSIFAR